MIVQVDVRSAQHVNIPKYLICTHQTQNWINVNNKNISTARFDNLDLRTYSVEIDGQRHPRDSLLMNYEENDYIEQ